jgi:hypothetical protein
MGRGSNEWTSSKNAPVRVRSAVRAIRAGEVPDMTAGIYNEAVFDFDPAIGQAV